MRIARISTLAALATSLVSVLGNGARADFSYSSQLFSTNPDGVQASSGDGAKTISFGDTKLTLSGQDVQQFPAPTDIVFGHLSVAPGTATDQKVSLKYDYQVTLTDLNGPAQSQTVDITGMIAGMVSIHGGKEQINLENFSNQSSYTVSFAGRGTYTIDLFNQDGTSRFTPPGVGGDPTQSGRFGAVVHFAAVPEPTSIALVAIGGLGTWLGFRRRRRAA